MKKCIAVLARGHAYQSGYDSLIIRNKHIQDNLEDKAETDVLIFHEGNISKTDQDYICEKTPSLCTAFVNVCEENKAFRKQKESVPVRAAYGFGVGYRHMCSFWFVDFWAFLNEYDLVVRIDDDCYIDFSLDWAFENLRTTCLIVGAEEPDDQRVVLGLNDFTIQFLREQKKFSNLQKRHPVTGPYTNVMGMNLYNLKRNITLRKYIRKVDESNKIYSHRWGDLPLWGEAVHYILTRNMMRVDPRIKYLHTSHSRYIN